MSVLADVDCVLLAISRQVKKTYWVMMYRRLRLRIYRDGHLKNRLS